MLRHLRSYRVKSKDIITQIKNQQTIDHLHCVKSVRIRSYKKCPYSELFWSVFPRIRTEYGEIRTISMYSVQMWENTDQNNSEYGHFLGSAWTLNDILKICNLC